MPRKRSMKHKMDNSATTFVNDERGVSIPIEHALGLLILLTLSGLFTAGIMQIADERENAVTQQELDRIADEVAAGIESTDGLVDQSEQYSADAGGDNVDAETRVILPDSLIGNSYSITINDAGVITVQSHGIEAQTTINVDRDVAVAGMGGGDIIIEYDNDTDEIIVVSG